jgi:hypothetical protein
MACAMLNDSGINRNLYWGKALRTAVYIRNRCPTKANGGKATPYKLLTGDQPNLS